LERQYSALTGDRRRDQESDQTRLLDSQPERLPEVMNGKLALDAMQNGKRMLQEHPLA